MAQKDRFKPHGEWFFMYVRSYNKKAATTSAAAFFRGNTTLFKGLAFICRLGTGLGIIGLDFLTYCRILHLPKGLSPVLNAAMQMHLSHMTSFDGARPATAQQKQSGNRKAKQRFHVNT